MGHHRRHGHRSSPDRDVVEDSDDYENGRTSDDSEDGRTSDDSEESLVSEPRHHHRRRKKQSPPASSDTTRNVVIGIIVFILVALVGVCVWYFFLYDPNSTSLFGGDSAAASGAAANTGATAATGMGAGAGGAGGAGGATTGGSGAGGTGGVPGGTSSRAASGASGGTGAAGGAGAATGGGGTGTGGTATGTKTADNPKGTGSGGGRDGAGGGKIAGFWETWVSMSVADTKFDMYDYCFWFCAVPGTVEEKGKLDMKEPSEGIAKEWVTASKAAGCKAMMSVGGWSGSETISKLVASESSRSDWAETIVAAMDEYGFEGVDLDWEYPGKSGATDDFDVENDLTNYLAFFKILREKVGDRLISSDTSSSPWIDSSGSPSADLSEFGEVLDFITIMTYDATTASSPITGPNFAFDDSCAPSAAKFNIPSSVQTWIDAKFPANKIMMGLASYGYGWKVADFKDGGGVDGATSSIYQTVTGKATEVNSGTYIYDLIVSDYLDSSERTFDDCSKSPFIYQKESTLMVTYDDEESFAIKGAYSREAGLMGCNIYAGMTQNKDGTLAEAARKVC
ncbi:glycoside hydrolase family 18 protein [Rhodotorula paludigena]|uniref:glycoside hydrolase family 18 protein n=1 Tax=Rhodotorula paludigena TaxID=86838 RepID=UPI00316AEFE8